MCLECTIIDDVTRVHSSQAPAADQHSRRQPGWLVHYRHDLENFATASRWCCQRNSSTVKLVDYTYDGRRVVAGCM